MKRMPKIFKPGLNCYQIRVKGHLDTSWSVRFEGLLITHNEDGNSTLEGVIVDQSALYGVIGQARDLGLTLIDVVRCKSRKGHAIQPP
jgi:hypothetical protein